MTKSEELRVAWAQSFGWIMLLIAGVVEIAVWTIFIHGTPHGHDADAATMMVFISLTLGVASVIGAFLTFALPQFFQALVSDVLLRLLGRPGQFGILAALPVTAILSWYCWDYLVPSLQLGINEGADWAPYQHGLTLTRYLTMLAVQTPVTLFSLAYCDAAIRQGSRKPAVRLALALALAIVAGVAFGVWRVTGQQQVLKPGKSDRLAWRGAQGGQALLQSAILARGGLRLSLTPCFPIHGQSSKPALRQRRRGEPAEFRIPIRA